MSFQQSLQNVRFGLSDTLGPCVFQPFDRFISGVDDEIPEEKISPKPAANKMVCIGAIRGDILTLLKLLYHYGVVDENAMWVGKDWTVVFTGNWASCDLIIQYLFALRKKATVVLMLGAKELASPHHAFLARHCPLVYSNFKFLVMGGCTKQEEGINARVREALGAGKIDIDEPTRRQIVDALLTPVTPTCAMQTLSSFGFDDKQSGMVTQQFRGQPEQNGLVWSLSPVSLGSFGILFIKFEKDMVTVRRLTARSSRHGKVEMHNSVTYKNQEFAFEFPTILG